MEPVSDILLSWFAREGRDLPWRRTRDPYRIWLSEVILQQTRVAQGLEYYLRFLRSGSPTSPHWQPRRGRGAQTVAGVGLLQPCPQPPVLPRGRSCLGSAGCSPATYGEVRALPGVGDYTAAAVCSIVYDAPCAVLDGNVYRVLARLFDIGIPIDTTAGKRTFAELAQLQLDTSRPGLYNQAIMDFGALQCTPAQPRCGIAPWLGGASPWLRARWACVL